MLANLKDILSKAKTENYCVPALGIGNEINFMACLRAAEEKKSPVIMLFMYGKNDIMRFGKWAREQAALSSVPVSIILDHGAEFDHAIQAIHAGFTDIMVDRSKLPFEENIAQVAELTRIAHACGMGVEAELGHVAMGDESVFTRPDEAREFVERTGVDALAVAIGTAHGAYKEKPQLQFELLKELRDTVPVPLVLHGGSGTGDENLKKACGMGINKLNVAYELYTGAIAGYKDYEAGLQEEWRSWAPYDLYEKLGEGCKAVAMHHMDLCGSTGKA